MVVSVYFNGFMILNLWLTPCGTPPCLDTINSQNYCNMSDNISIKCENAFTNVNVRRTGPVLCSNSTISSIPANYAFFDLRIFTAKG